MAVKIWDSETQAFRDANNVPKRYSTDDNAWVDTTGNAFNTDAGAWEEKWGNKKTIIFDNGINPFGIYNHLKYGSHNSCPISNTISMSTNNPYENDWTGCGVRTNEPIDLSPYQKLFITVDISYNTYSSKVGFLLGIGSDSRTDTYNRVPEPNTWILWWHWGNGTASKNHACKVAYRVDKNSQQMINGTNIFSINVSSVNEKRYFCMEVNAINGKILANITKIWLEK